MLGWILACAEPPDTIHAPAEAVTVETLGAPTVRVVINEFMPENDAAWAGTGTYPDWVELYNPDSIAADLREWTLSDDRSEPDKGAVGQVLGAGSWLILDGDALGFGLAGAGGEIGLFAPDGSGSIVTYGEVAADFSVARRSDGCAGSDCFEFVWYGTPGSTNG